jgi:hypothetical protein
VLRRIPGLRFLVAPLAVVMNLRAMFEDRITPAAVRNDNACVYIVRASVKDPR